MNKRPKRGTWMGGEGGRGMRSGWAREIRGGGGEIRGRRLANQRAAADAAVYAEITGE